MEKVVAAGSWDFGQPTSELVKISSAGLVGNDLKQFLKRASHSFTSQLERIKIAKDEIPIHVIAIGSTEHYGPNRNLDGFKEATCREYHGDFVKNAKVYQNHKNKDPKKSYGVIKASAYNEDMHRIELLLTVNASKEAAERNDGLFDPAQVDRILKNGDFKGSMGTKVAYDVCSSCGNKARTRNEYCEEDACIGPRGEKRGGCKHNLGKLAADGHLLHVDNPNPRFFDFSDVFRPADRIAYGGVATYLEKAASAGEVIGGAQMAEAYGMRMSLNANTDLQYEMACKLAEAEQKLANDLVNPVKRQRLDSLSMAFNTTADIDMRFLQTKQADAIRALADTRSSLSLRDFLTANGRLEKYAEVAERIPGVYSRMMTSDGFLKLLDLQAYSAAPSLTTAARQWGTKCAADYSLDMDQARLRVTKSVIFDGKPRTFRKVSSVSLVNEAERLAWQYGLCKLAFLTTMNPTSEEIELAILQNYVS